MNPILSIIIPFYGTADKTLLERCLNSIRTQNISQEKYELIIADSNGKDLGAGAARNNGIRQANGEYLLFVDADDYLFPNSLLHCLTFLEKEHPDILSFKFQKVKRVKKAREKPSIHIISIHLEPHLWPTIIIQELPVYISLEEHGS